MLVKTEKQKMPFVPNFGIIFIFETIVFSIWLWAIREFAEISYFYILLLIWLCFALCMYLWKQKYIQEANKLYSEYENLNFYNDISALRKQKNILEILLHYKKRITFFPYSIYNEMSENNQKIVTELQNNKNYKIGILHIAEQLHSEENETIILRIHIWFQKNSIFLRNLWEEIVIKRNEFFWKIGVIGFILTGIISLFPNRDELFIFIMPCIFISFLLMHVFNYKNTRPSLYVEFKTRQEDSGNYVYLLQKSSFYHSKLDDFYNLVFHENNFLPETPLLFADIITLLSENFRERKKFLEKYRKLWKDGLKVFFIFPMRIPTEVEKIISEEEKNLAIEIKNIQDKIREWAEFEKKKIAIISKQNKEFFPNLELSTKRQEMLVKNFENLSR